MHCIECGYQHQRFANFCANCGLPVTPNNGSKSSYELCEVNWEEVKENNPGKDAQGRFVADVIGSKGNYCVAKSKCFMFNTKYGPRGNTDLQVESHDEIVNKLISEGWELIKENNSPWYNLQFKRAEIDN